MGQIETMNAQVSDAAAEDSKENGSALHKKAGTWSANFAYNSVGMEIERLLPGGVRAEMEYDEAGRPVRQKVTRGRSEMRHRTYNWSVNDRLKIMVDQLTKGQVSYTHDQFGNLASAKYENNDMDYKLPDEVGNLYRSQGKSDRKYGAGGQLLKDGRTTFKYDDEGNLTEKRTPSGTEVYDWYGNGMLQAVTKTNGERVEFEYDALGRRTAKNVIPARAKSRSSITRFVWDGNVPLHEWKYPLKDRPEWMVDEWGMLTKDKEEPVENLITWVFDEGTFKPAAKIVDGEHFSIITDYLGTPVEMYNAQGEKTWAVEYDIYGKVRKLVQGSLEDCPFRYQGQFEDVETGLYYNRFRYYSPDEGGYLSQDPIRLDGGDKLYGYVRDSNKFVDSLGLMPIPTDVSFSGSPDLFPTVGNQKNIVKIVLTGDRSSDFTRAFKEAGINSGDAGDYTWHHVHDFDPTTGTSTMELVTTEAHKSKIPHKGSAGQFADYFGVKYDTYEAKMKAYEQGWRKKPKKRKPKVKVCN